MLAANKHHSKYYCSSSWYEISTWICFCCLDYIQCDWSYFLQFFLQYSWTTNNHAMSRKGDKMYPKWNDSLKLKALSGVGPVRLFSKFPHNICLLILIQVPRCISVVPIIKDKFPLIRICNNFYMIDMNIVGRGFIWWMWTSKVLEVSIIFLSLQPRGHFYV